MDRIQYLKHAVKAGACYYKTWLIDSMGIVDLPPKPETVDATINPSPGLRQDEPPRYPHEEHPYQLFDFKGTPVFLNPTTNEWEPVDGYKKGAPFFRFKEEINLEPGDIANVKEPITTWIGNLLVNQCVLCYPFGDLIPFQMGQFSIKKVEAIIAAKLESLPDVGQARDETKIYVDTLENYYYDAAYSLSGWTQLAVPAASPHTLITDPKIRKRRIELLNEYKDQLDDPAIIAKIMQELIDMDVAFQADDPEGGYLQPGKSFDVVRAKAFLMYGIERDFNDPNKIVLIDRPLSEGWDITKLPYMVNALIEGSFYRGAMTALGGEGAKFIQRFFLNTNIIEEDCGVKYGKSAILKPKERDDYLGASVVGPGGSRIELTEDNYDQHVGKPLQIFSPQYCKTKRPNFCVKCLGARYRGKPNSPAALASVIGSVLMYIFMKKMHGVALKTKKWDWRATAE